MNRRNRKKKYYKTIRERMRGKYEKKKGGKEEKV